jgi:hypothetical protein
LGNDFNSYESACLNKLKIEKIKLDPKNYPQDLLSTINTIEDYTQAYIDGDFDRAESLSIELEKSASRLHKLKDDIPIPTFLKEPFI